MVRAVRHGEVRGLQIFLADGRVEMSCCRFRGHRDKVFMKLEDSDDEKELQPGI